MDLFHLSHIKVCERNGGVGEHIAAMNFLQNMNPFNRELKVVHFVLVIQRYRASMISQLNFPMLLLRRMDGIQQQLQVKVAGESHGDVQRIIRGSLKLRVGQMGAAVLFAVVIQSKLDLMI
jgi:hypothetical protein